MPDNAPQDPVLVTSIGTAGHTVLRNARYLLGRETVPERLQVVHFDTDPTESHPNASEPLNTNGLDGSWGPNSFVRLDLPSKDYLDSVKRGERGGVADHLAPEMLRRLDSLESRGAGGVKVIGAVTGRVNRSRIKGEIRRRLTRISDASEDVSGSDTEVNVLELAGTMGGMCGAVEEVHDAIVEVAEDLGIEVAFERIIFFPGNHPSRDMNQSRANSYAFLKEFAARSTGRYVWLRESDVTGDWEPELAPTVGSSFFISDKNNAPKAASTCSTRELFSLVAHWVHLRVATPFGPNLDSELVDFQDDADSRNKHGERRTARSFGMSMVSLNRERIQNYSTERLTREALGKVLGDEPASNEGSDPDEVEEEVRDFLDREGLLEGDGFDDLSGHLRSEGTVGDLKPVERFREVYTEHLSAHDEGINRLTEAPRLLQATEQSLRQERENALEKVAKEKESESAEAIRQFVDLKVWERGAQFAKACAEELVYHLESIIEKTKETNRTRENRIEKREEALETIEDEGIAGFKEMSSLRQLTHKTQIQNLTERYVRQATSLVDSRVEHTAGRKALSILEELRDLAQALHLELAEFVDHTDQAIDAADNEVDRIAGWEGTLEIPNGMALDEGEERLEDLYLRSLQRQGEEIVDPSDREKAAARELVQQLEADYPSVFDLTGDGKLEEEVRSRAAARTEPRVQNFHVQEELLRRYDEKQDETLGGFLRERDREAYERIRLTDTTRRDDGEQVLRFVCGDGRYGRRLTSTLNDHARTRDNGEATYRFINIQDPERLYVLQVRLTVPPGQFADLPTCRSAYRKRTEDLFENLHSEPVGRHLPDLGEEAGKQDRQRALAKAFALGALKDGSPLVYKTFRGEKEKILERLGTRQLFDLRTEIATRFFCAYRRMGPEPLRERLEELGKGLRDSSDRSPVVSALAEEISVEAIEAAREDLDWYVNNTIQQSALWNHTQ